MTIQKKRIFAILGIVTLILLIPFIAMQFTDEVQWKAGDFAIMGGILLSIGFAFELIARRSEKIVYRAAFAVALFGAFLLFWVNAAVGIIGDEGQVANLLYGAVFLVGIVGVAWSKFKAEGMSKTMFAVTITQLIVPLVALLIWPPSTISWAPGLVQVFMMNGFFAMIFAVSALLFRKAHLD